MRSAFYLRFIAPLLIAIIQPYDLLSQGDLQVSTRHVTLNNEKPSQQISVMNAGTDTVVYVVSVVNYKAKGDFLSKKNTEAASIPYLTEPNLHVSTRKIMLAPMESQEIKISLLNDSSVTPGEYCAQVYLRPAGLRVVTGEEANKQHRSAQNQQLALQILPAIGITIPVIIRIGTSGNPQISAQ